jgi:carbon-monoxide dehydrogenase medium subunit
MYDFDYVRPSSIDDAVQALGASGDAALLAGGQTLIPTLKLRLANPSTLVDLGGIPGLNSIAKQGNDLVIGAITTHAQVVESKDVQDAIPALAYLADTIGDGQVRNRGTIGGSLANNDPAADYPAAVLGLGATIVTNAREIPADDFFTGYFSTALGEDEIITSVRFPIPLKASYAKFEQRASRFALVGVFVAQTANGIRVAVTGAGENGVFRSPELEAALSDSFSSEAAAAVSIPAEGLVGDMHGSAEYRAALVVAMAQEAAAAAG